MISHKLRDGNIDEPDQSYTIFFRFYHRVWSLYNDNIGFRYCTQKLFRFGIWCCYYSGNALLITHLIDISCIHMLNSSSNEHLQQIAAYLRFKPLNELVGYWSRIIIYNLVPLSFPINIVCRYIANELVLLPFDRVCEIGWRNFSAFLVINKSTIHRDLDEKSSSNWNIFTCSINRNCSIKINQYSLFWFHSYHFHATKFFVFIVHFFSDSYTGEQATHLERHGTSEWEIGLF